MDTGMCACVFVKTWMHRSPVYIYHIHTCTHNIIHIYIYTHSHTQAANPLQPVYLNSGPRSRHTIYTFLDTGALWKRSYMAQNQLRHHITFSYFPSCDLDAIFSLECSWHAGDFAPNCWRNEHFLRSLTWPKSVFLRWKLQILTTKLPAEERTNGAHHDYTTQLR